MTNPPQPQAGMYAYWRDHGRVWVESVNPRRGAALVRFDAKTGMRSLRVAAPLAEIDFTRECRFR